MAKSFFLLTDCITKSKNDMNKEEQDYLKRIESAFNEQRNVQLRKLTMTKERYQQLAYTYCKITDNEELADFAFISTHEDVRTYYLSDTNLALLERISRIKIPESHLDKCIGHEYCYIDEDKLREEYICGHSLAVHARLDRPISINPIKIELTQRGLKQLLLLFALVPFLGLSLLALVKLLALLAQNLLK